MGNYLVIDREPFVGYMPNDIRNWLRDHDQESDIACVMAIVHNKVGILGHLCDEAYDPWVEYAYEEWYEIESELLEQIIIILSVENKTKGTDHTLTGAGLHYMIKPFMERHGYRDGAGWWIKAGGGS